jgi:light-regulated signal transduction histidine kinase (bacteriophytochrome)
MPDLTVTQVSESVVHHLGVGVDDVLGRPLAGVLTRASAERVAAVLAQGSWRDENPLRVTAHNAEHDGILHEHDGVAILELEPAQAEAGTARTHRPLLAAIQRAGALEELSAIVVDAVKRLSKFERVMLYRFADDGSGSVEAEAKEAALEPYLGLRYPASDIPRQARELYLKNWLRIIPDRQYVPSRLVPALRPDTGRPLDLSFSVLRSVSPIHLQYMANMGVRASMSASLIVGDRLWGLISCVNHSGPLGVPYELRSAIEVLARTVSLQIGALAEREATSIRRRRLGTRDVLAARVRDAHEDRGVLLPLLTAGQDLLQLAAADGAAVVLGDSVATFGRAPATATVRSIASWLDDRAGTAPFATSELPRILPAATDAKEVASGVLSIALPGTPSRRIIWFRGEIIRTVRWGGDPHKMVQADAGEPLRPRHSFESWKEEVRLTSHRWTASDTEAATELLRSLVEIDLERQVAREQRATRVREDLMAFVSHDLKNPLTAIAGAATMIKMRLGAPSAANAVQAKAADTILRSADRMKALIGDLLDAAKIEAGQFSVRPRPEPIDDIVSDALVTTQPLAEAKHLAFHTDIRDHGLVLVDRERAFQLLSNLIGNAIKFTPAEGAVSLTAERSGDAVLFSIADTGPGISREDLEHVFDRYWHAPSDRFGGSGLGLSIAKGIVEAHGGRIWAESLLGSGARFLFVLPSSDGKSSR